MFNKISSYFLLFLLRLISLLPFRILYLLSDFLYFILYKVFGYRTKVVRGNLKRSFPEKSDAELREIESKFYRHLCDLIIESIKMFTISQKELDKRIRCINQEFVDSLYDKGISLIGVTGHYNSWEMLAIGLNLNNKHQAMGIYKKINNEVINNAMIKSRSRFGTLLADTKSTSKLFEENKDKITVTGFVADQWPSNIHKCFWTSFLGQETAVSYGAEHYARIHGMGVVFGKVRKAKRGFYEVEYVLVAEDARKLEPGEVTKRHTKILEELIKENPQYWVWSHKRWKKPRPDNVPLETVFS